jgi:DNA polymerase-3 subunit beta
MKITCTHENLKKGLSLTTRVSSGNLTLPILNNILIKTDNGQLKISSTNLEVAVNTWIRCKIDEEGGISVPAKTFSELVNNLPSENIELHTEDSQLFIESGTFKTKIRGLAPEDFPLIPQINQQAAGEIDVNELKTAFSQVVFAAAFSETQPEISGILMNFSEGQLTIAATDRYRLAEKKLKIQSSFENKEVIVPNRSIQELLKLLSSAAGGKAQLFFTQNQVMFKALDTEIISRLIDGQYPDYKQIIPASFKTEIECQTTDVVAAMRTAGIFTQAGNNVNLAFSEPGIFSITSASNDIGESDVEVPSKVSGEAGTVIFNHRYVLDCLSVLDAATVRIRVIDSNSPAIIDSKELQGYTYLVMPIRI